MKPSEFQQAKTLVSHIAVFQYAITKKETGKEWKALYKIVFMDEEEGEDPETSAEMKGFVRVNFTLITYILQEIIFEDTTKTMIGNYDLILNERHEICLWWKMRR